MLLLLLPSLSLAHGEELQGAAKAGDVAQVQLLLDRGVDIDERDGIGKSALFWAYAEGKAAVAELLLARGATKDAGMMFAVVSGNRKKIEAALEEGPKLVNVEDSQRRTPLHWAAYSGQTALAEIFLARGAAVEARDLHRDRPLHLAVTQAHPEMVKLLLTHRANVNAPNRQGQTALTLALATQNPEMIELLRQKGGQETALADDIHEAVRRGNLEKIKALLKENPACVNEKADCGCAPLHHAIKWHQKAAAEQLLTGNPDLTLVGADGKTALGLALQNHQADLATLLRQRGAKE